MAAMPRAESVVFRNLYVIQLVAVLKISEPMHIAGAQNSRD